MKNKNIKRKSKKNDPDLMKVAQKLNKHHFGGKLDLKPITYANLTNEWGLCESRKIRIESEVRNFPKVVIEYMVMHEITHLRYGKHSHEFWNKAKEFEGTAWAEGFLDGITWNRDGCDTCRVENCKDRDKGELVFLDSFP